jgi:hypothetical protein
VDSGAVDSAVIGLLQNDATLKGLLPDGVFFDSAPQGAQRFAIVSISDHADDYLFEGKKAFERFEYFVKAVIFSNSASDARKACTQIDALLQNADTRLAPTGYRVLRCQRLAYRRYSEPDVNPAQHWQHEGGNYELDVVPTTEG